MSFPEFQTVVKGEASETDDEEEMYVTSVPVSTLSAACGVKIQGEASETDDEEDSIKDRNDIHSKRLEKELPRRPRVSLDCVRSMHLWITCGAN